MTRPAPLPDRRPGARPSGGLVGALLSRPLSAAHLRFQVTAADGVRIRGVLLDGSSRTLLIYAHGFLGSCRFRAVPRLLTTLAGSFRVAAFDFRGHGWSEGRCSFGADEALDVAAVLDYLGEEVRPTRTVLVGASMGAAPLFGHAQKAGRGLALVGIVPLLAPQEQLSPLGRLVVRLLFQAPPGPALARALYGTRLGELRPAATLDRLRAGLAGAPLLLITTARDPFLRRRTLEELYRAHPGPKELVHLPGLHFLLQPEPLAWTIRRWVAGLPGG